MNSLELKEVQELRDTLFYSLKCWDNPKDGFYRSSPTAKLSETPSFTNTGIVLQAFNECGDKDQAQKLANGLLNYLEGRSGAPFPNEKAKENEKPHVICNAWVTFGILNCYPDAAERMKGICDWFLDSQKSDYSWDLIPGEEMNYPAVTAYALGALLQLQRGYIKINYDTNYLDKIACAIKNGIDYLLENRSPLAKDADLYLWPVNLNDTGHVASFGTTALCLHVIYEASKALNRKDLGEKNGNTLLILITSFDESTKGNVIQVGNIEVNIWDQIHANESSLNYLWAFFSPIYITTLLKYVDNRQFMSNEKYFRFIEYLTQWILNNVSVVDGFTGVRGSQNIPGVKTWSTAQSVIVLSRMLNKRGLFRAHLSEVQEKDEPKIFFKCISERNKDWVRFCLVQMDYNLMIIPPKDGFGWRLSDNDATEKKIFSALEIASLNKVDIICFPELSFSKEIENKIRMSGNYKDIIIIGGSYYENSHNTCSLIIDGNILDPPYRKCTPSVSESGQATGRGMKAGNLIYILQTSCGCFSVLTCSDYPKCSGEVCGYNTTVDFIINPCYDSSISRFQEKVSSDCDIFAIDVIQVNKAPDGNKYGKSCIIGREHNGIKDNLINEKFRPKFDVRHKLCELNNESMLIADINIGVKGPLASITPDYQGRIKVRRDKIYGYNGDRWQALR